MGVIDDICADARWWCENGNLGYDQWQRYTWEQSGYKPGTEVDCSSFVIGLLKKHGLQTGGATYTGNMSTELCKHGWVRLPNNGNPQKGDILLNDTHHTALYIGNGLVAQASRGEYGHRVHGGQAGDQDGQETNIRRYYNYPWTCYLRYTGAGATQPSHPAAPKHMKHFLAVDGWWGSDTTTVAQKVFGTIQDGVVSGQASSNKKYLIRIGNGWNFSGTGQSMLIRAMQRWLGVTVDGYFGKHSIMALQRKLGVAADGYMGEITVKAFQKYLNSKL